MIRPGAVASNQKKNKALAVYFVVLTVLGSSLLGASFVLDWGFWGYFGGGFLLFAGVASLISQRKFGGAGKAECPLCQATFDVMNIGISRVSLCPSCHNWLVGAGDMVPVAQGFVNKTPAFEAPLPEEFMWPDGCTVCQGAATRSIQVKGISPAGALAIGLAPIAVVKVSKVDAPACDAHKDGVGLTRWPHATMIAFRSFDYWKRFCEINNITEEQVSDAYWKRSETMRQTAGALNYRK